jgi:hypothetical protein
MSKKIHLAPAHLTTKSTPRLNIWSNSADPARDTEITWDFVAILRSKRNPS